MVIWLKSPNSRCPGKGPLGYLATWPRSGKWMRAEQTKHERWTCFLTICALKNRPTRQDSINPFHGQSPLTGAPTPTPEPLLLKVPPLTNAATLGTKLPAQKPLWNKPHPNSSAVACLYSNRAPKHLQKLKRWMSKRKGEASLNRNSLWLQEKMGMIRLLRHRLTFAPLKSNNVAICCKPHAFEHVWEFG